MWSNPIDYQSSDTVVGAGFRLAEQLIKEDRSLGLQRMSAHESGGGEYRYVTTYPLQKGTVEPHSLMVL